MAQIEIKLFDGFRLCIDGKAVSIPEKERETLALLAAAGGYGVTAKRLWQVLYEPKRYSYSGNHYTSRITRLTRALSLWQIKGILIKGVNVVRYTAVDRSCISCDYYKMLDGKIPLKSKEKFLPEYPWAAELYSTSWKELKGKWHAIK